MLHSTADRLAPDGLRLFTQSWLPAGEIRAVVVLVHGLGEHSSRYAHLASALTDAGYAVHSLDHRGHGRSEGRRVQVHHFGELVDDLRDQVASVRAEHPGLPLFVLGHSMGGLVSLAFVIEHPDGIAGLIVSGTAAMPPPGTSKATIAAARVISRVAPNLGVSSLPLDKVSRDSDVVRAYFDDPLISKNKIRARMGVELLGAMAMVDAGAPSLQLPMLILHGSDDVLSPAAASRHLEQRVGSPDKTLTIYEGLWHEIFNEPERDRVIADVLAWLAHQLAAQAKPC